MSAIVKLDSSLLFEMLMKIIIKGILGIPFYSTLPRGSNEDQFR